MPAIGRNPLLLILAGTAVAACGRELPPPPPAATAVTRPVASVAVRNGRILVPRDAIIERGGITGVFVLDAGSLARFRMVRPGKAENGRVEVLSGLTTNDAVIMGELRDIRDGSVITLP